MAMTPEGAVKNLVKKVLDAYNVYYFMPAANGYGKAGVPDIICCYMGKFVAIECKAKGGKPTALQVRELERIRTANGVAIVVDEHTIDSVAAVLETIKERLSA
jgi:Holliday junction resolvase